MKKRRSRASFQWKPFSRKQKKLLTWWTLKSPYKDYDMIICDGSIRAGKTVAMIDSFLTWSMSSFRNQSFIIAGKSMGALKRNVLKPMFQILNSKGISYNYNRSEHFIEIGSNVFFCFGASNESSQDVLQGLTAAGAYLDEAVLFPRSFVEQAIGRCSVEGSKVWMNCNPGGPFHYLMTDYIQRASEKKILHLHFTLDDNPSLSQQVKERYKRMFTGLFFQRFILGLWVLAQGIVYSMFSKEKHIVSRQQIPWDDFKEYEVWIDYGSTNPTVFLLAGIRQVDGHDDFWIIKEYYHKPSDEGDSKTTGEHAEDLRQFIRDVPSNSIVAVVDSAAKSFITELIRKGFISVRSSDKEVLEGIRHLSNILQDGRYHVTEECTNHLREFQSYVWDEKAAERGEDKPKKEHDHTLDAARYGVFTRNNVSVKVLDLNDDDDWDEDDEW